MVNCHDMKLDQVYICDDCGLELKVIAECKECGTTDESCGCDEHCDFACCGIPMKLKE